ncbi:MAG: PQQ-like beta-propeller repeat protein [Planctomycetes bacterium]|nr:PQQ-like beta-propeller repeat protein [Planctomycetota bacterium]
MLFFTFTSGLAEDWPQFRGPGGEGHSSEKDLPLIWSETENIAWKAAIPGLGWSSPVIHGEQIWLTAALDGGSLRALSLHRDTGKLFQGIEVFKNEDLGPIHSKNSHASPTPIIEKNRVYVHFGAYGTAALSTDGKILWTAELRYNHRHGPAGSPVLFEELLIISCDGTDVQFVVALEKETGKVRWKSNRHGPMAYSTPLILRGNGAEQLISTGGNRVLAYDPRNGKELWWSDYDGYSLVPRPVFGHGLLFICSGFNNPSLFAIRPEGKGDVTRTHVEWSLSRGVPLTPSPLIVGDELYIVSDSGVATSLDARTGKPHWQSRLGGNFSASPVYADGRIYFLNEEGETTVIAPGKEFKKLAANQLPGRTLASMAVSGKAIYLRTDTHLYRIQKR